MGHEPEASGLSVNLEWQVFSILQLTNISIIITYASLSTFIDVLVKDLKVEKTENCI